MELLLKKELRFVSNNTLKAENKSRQRAIRAVNVRTKRHHRSRDNEPGFLPQL